MLRADTGGADRAGAVVEVQAHDVGFAPGDAEHALAPPPIMIGGSPVCRRRHAFEPDGVDVRAVEVDLTLGEVGPDQSDVLLEPVEADTGAVPGDAHRFVLALQPSGTDADLEPTLGEERRASPAPSRT